MGFVKGTLGWVRWHGLTVKRRKFKELKKGKVSTRCGGALGLNLYVKCRKVYVEEWVGKFGCLTELYPPYFLFLKLDYLTEIYRVF